jgi:glycosyltransferase involved in cell wall biosynthesis
MVDYIYKRCRNIYATSESFKKRLEERDSTWKYTDDNHRISKVIYWPQYAEDFYKPYAREKLPSDMDDNGEFKIVFTGNVGYAQGLDILPKAAAVLKKQEENCKFIIIGTGRYMDNFKKDIKSEGVDEMFSLLGRKAPHEIPEYLAWCDVAFISFADNVIFNMTIPAKLQSYMACGKPILAAAGGETRQIIEDAKCGIVAKTGDYIGLADCIKKLIRMSESDINMMGNNSLEYVNKYFNKDKLFNEMDGIIEDISG